MLDHLSITKISHLAYSRNQKELTSKTREFTNTDVRGPGTFITRVSNTNGMDTTEIATVFFVSPNCYGN